MDNDYIDFGKWTMIIIYYNNFRLWSKIIIINFRQCAND